MISLYPTHIFKKGMIINCTLESFDINPQQVNFTWYSCGTSKCDEESAKLINELYSLHLDSQSTSVMNYRCKAQNAAGSAYKDIEVHRSESIKIYLTLRNNACMHRHVASSFKIACIIYIYRQKGHAGLQMMIVMIP